MTKIRERQIAAASAVLMSILAVATVIVIISLLTRGDYGTAAVAAQQMPSKNTYCYNES
jgi:hypothetical protein